MPNTKIKLAVPITGHEGQITEVELREPKARDFFELGEPIAWGQSKAGVVFNADKEEVIKAYIDRCLVNVDPLLMEQLSLADGMRLRDAMVDFFLAARALTSATPATP